MYLQLSEITKTLEQVKIFQIFFIIKLKHLDSFHFS